MVRLGPFPLRLKGLIIQEEKDRDAWRAAYRAQAADRRIAGVGAADVVASAAPDGIVSLFRQLRQRLERSGTSARYFGGLRFCRASSR